LLKNTQPHFLGKKGELAARNFLEEKGCKIRCVNFRGKNGEVDIIAEDGDTIVFVEVKTRTSNDPVKAIFAIDKKKRMHIEKTCIEYLKKEKLKGIDIRFDVILLVKKDDGNWHIELIKDAFGSSGRLFY
jgi:putative endonuclease